MWRFADRYDLAMLVQAARTVARGPVARLVANGARNSHEWTPEKASLLPAFDESGITAAFLDPQHGGFIEGPKNLALALIAFELAWVDAGAATCSLAGNLGLAPIHERGTPEQRDHYMTLAAPPKPGENRQQIRAAFALTEPIPFVGVETGMLGGKVRVAEWKDGQEPILQVEKRGRFITNMGFANVVTAAVDSDDPRIKGACMVILEETDPGTWDRGTPTKKLVHQLSSTRDPVLNVRVPASRIIGGYTVKDGVIIPRYSNSEIIEAVFRRTRVTVGLMTSAKLLSADRAGHHVSAPPFPRRRGRARHAPLRTRPPAKGRCPPPPGGCLGHRRGQRFAGLRRRPAVRRTRSAGKAEGRLPGREEPHGPRRVQGLMAAVQPMPSNTCALAAKDPEPPRREAPRRPRKQTRCVQFVILDSLANVLCPACKLWNTGHGANMMREAVSLMGGYGVTEDCPGFLGQKWMDAQLEATYEGPEAVQRLPALHHHDQRAVPRAVPAVDRRTCAASPPSAPAPAPARSPPP